MSYRYKNVSGSDQAVVGIGSVVAGQEFDSTVPIENPNFELVKTEHAAQAPAQVTHVEKPQEEQE